MLNGKNVLVAGAGVTGKSVAAALLGAGARVTVTDAAPDRLTDLPAGVTTLPGLDAPPEATDLVVTSPGWPPNAPLLVAAAAAGVEVIGEVELAWRLGQTLPTVSDDRSASSATVSDGRSASSVTVSDGRSASSATAPVWLAVTGTDGKTTTVGMLESILLAAGVNAVACGNIGLPVVDAVLSGHEVLAVELSSYQLHWQSSMRAHAAVVLNVAEDHLEWHGSLAGYVADKGKIYTGAGLAVYNADDVESERLAASSPKRVGFTLGTPAAGQFGCSDGWLVHGDLLLAPIAEVRPVGPHNVANALAAAALARALGVSATAVRAGLNAFQPPAHRVELVGERDGVRYVNDSKATNTHAAQGSLGAFDHVVWIAGGLLHGAEVADLVTQAASRLRGVVLIGADQDVFAAALARHAPDVPVHRVPSRDDDPMLTAVRVANAMALTGDVVLLAPAAKSHDLFASYVHRGTAFADAVRNVLAERG